MILKRKISENQKQNENRKKNSKFQRKRHIYAIKNKITLTLQGFPKSERRKFIVSLA